MKDSFTILTVMCAHHKMQGFEDANWTQEDKEGILRIGKCRFHEMFPEDPSVQAHSAPPANPMVSSHLVVI